MSDYTTIWFVSGWLPLKGEVGRGLPDIQNGLKKLGFESPWMKK